MYDGPRNFKDTDIKYTLPLEIWELTKPKIQKAERILEIGVGSGNLLYNLKETCRGSVCGIDISLKCCSFVKHLAAEASILCADGLHMPFLSGSFDAVFCSQVIEHVDDYALSREVFKVLKRKGLFVVSSVVKKRGAVYFRKSKHMQDFALNKGHLREYQSEQELREVLLSSGFNCSRTTILPLRYSLLDPLISLLCKLFPFVVFKEIYTNVFFAFLRKVFMVTIPKYYVVMITAEKLNEK